jgi:sigma-B regulation protein RsbU (phosphoserine phosphatase)
MSIRVKLLVLLLVFSMGPLLVGSWLTVLTLGRTGQRLAEESRVRLNNISDATRANLVERLAGVLERELARAEAEVRRAGALLRRVEHTGQPPAPPAIYTSTDFDAQAVPGLMPLAGQFRVRPDGQRESLVGSQVHPVFVFQEPGPRDGDPELFRQSQMQDAALLHGLLEIFRVEEGLSQGEIRIQSRYAAMDRTRTHLSWPGKGGYPADFDPTRRAWYQAAINTLSYEDVVWVGPLVDAPTGQVRMTCAAPVYTAENRLLGVVAEDLLLLDVIREIELPESFRGQSKAMLVTIDAAQTRGRPVPRIVATEEYDGRAGADTGIPLALDPFTADEPDAGERLYEALRSADAGSIGLRYRGAPWVWTFRRVSGEATFVLVGISREAADQAATQVSMDVSRTINTTIGRSLLGAVLVLALVGGVAYFGSRTVTHPVRELASAASAIAEGDLTASVRVSGADELGLLARSFNEMVPKLRERMEVKQALQVAREVQQNLLPSAPPQVPGLEIAAASVYADETGGDYFDFFAMADGRQAVAIGDVTGHGVGSALLMATARAHLHASARGTQHLAEVMGHVNRSLADDARSGQFMTMFLLTIEPGTGAVAWVSAGHDAAMVLDLDTRGFLNLEGEDIPLGIDGHWPYNLRQSVLPERCVLVLGTDGIWESRSPGGDMFGKHRLEEVILRHADEPAERISEAIQRAVAEFRAGGRQLDDVTLIVVRQDRTQPPVRG